VYWIPANASSRIELEPEEWEMNFPTKGESKDEVEIFFQCLSLCYKKRINFFVKFSHKMNKNKNINSVHSLNESFVFDLSRNVLKIHQTKKNVENCLSFLKDTCKSERKKIESDLYSISASDFFPLHHKCAWKKGIFYILSMMLNYVINLYIFSYLSFDSMMKEDTIEWDEC
jgi:hypothetical protein